MAYWRLFYHFVWATKNRAPLIVPEIEDEMYTYLRGKIAFKDARVYAVGGVKDHLHIAASVHPKLALSDFVHRIKGSTSHHINSHMRPAGHSLYFQDGYGVHSFSEKDLHLVVRYIQNQKEHHAKNDLFPMLERWSSDDDPPIMWFDPQT